MSHPEVWRSGGSNQRLLDCKASTLVVLLSQKKHYTGKADPYPESFIALIPEKNVLPSMSDSLVAVLKLILELRRSMTKPTK